MDTPPVDTQKSDDSQERIDAFKKESTELAQKYGCDLYAFPGFLPNEDGSFRLVVNLQIVDVNKFKQKSPYQIDDLK